VEGRGQRSKWTTKCSHASWRREHGRKRGPAIFSGNGRRTVRRRLLVYVDKLYNCASQTGIYLSEKAGSADAPLIVILESYPAFC
jgi:hypothetical protein